MHHTSIGRPNATPWFARRRLGWGWRPITWQGWVISLILVALAASALTLFRRSPASIGALAVIATAYALAARATGTALGEPPATTGEDKPLRGIASAGTALATSPVPVRQTPPAAGEPCVMAASTPPAPHAAQATSALVVDHLTKYFGEHAAFEDVSFTVQTGEVFGFLGPNGAGKTTMVRTLGTLIVPTAGSARVAGLPLRAGHGEEIRQRIAIMPETPGLYPRLSVTENLAFFAGLYGLRNAGPRIDQALEAVNLTARARDLAGSLSKGLRQRAALARALLNDPAILFLDEPTAGLDPVAAREVHDLINGLRRRGVTVFLTTHRLDEAERLCDRVAILNTRLVTIGRPDELRQTQFSRSLVVTTAAPLSRPDQVFMGLPAVQSWRAGEATGGDAASYVLTVSDPAAAAPGVSRALVAAGADIVSITEARHSLEDVYLELVDNQEGRS